MTDRASTQTSFLGGEWSPSALGEIDDPNYKRALASSFNGYPTEEGAWTARGGTMLVGGTKNGYDGIARTWYVQTAGTDPSQLQGVIIELSYGPGDTGGAGTLQVWKFPYGSPTYSIATPYPSQSSTRAVQMVATDIGVFFLSQLVTPYVLTYNFNSDTFLFQNAHFERLDGPYLDPLAGASQTFNSLGTVSGTGPGSITFTITDGAYAFGANDIGRSIRLWNQPPAWNGGNTYVSGNCVSYNNTSWIAIASVPAGTIPGQVASLPSSTGGTTSNFAYVSPWGLVPQQATWAYGSITAVAGAACTVNLYTPLRNAFAGLNGNTTVIDSWQLGVYIPATSQNPAVGCWHEGRLWLGGALPGRLDASMTNGIPISPVPGGAPIGNNGSIGPLFSPSDQFGAVTADSGISEVFNAEGANMPLWLIPEQQGILMGTAQKEWLVQASNQNDVITPTSIQIHPITKYGSSRKQAVRVGIAIAYIQAFGRRVIELVADVFSGRFIGRHINEKSKHLSNRVFEEISYQEEPTPLIWAIDFAGNLFSCTYRRVSHFGQEDPKFAAWSRHAISRWGGGAGSIEVTSVADTTLVGGAADQPILAQSSTVILTGISNANVFAGLAISCQIEIMTPPHEPGEPAWQAWPVDGGVSGKVGGLTITGAPNSTVAIAGLPTNYNGSRLTTYMCGLDYGDVQASGGAIFVPLPASGTGSAQWIIDNYKPLSDTGGTLPFSYWTTPITIKGLSFRVPCCVGFKFPSSLQLPRKAGQETEGQTGIAVGKIRRTHMWGAIFSDTVSNGLVVSAKMTTQSQQANTTFDPAASSPTVDFPVVFRYPNGSPMPPSSLYTGVFWDTIEGDYNFDDQITITKSRPGPMTIAAISNFMDVTDR